MAKKAIKKVVVKSVFPEIVKDSAIIRQYLLRRWDELDMNEAKICADAVKRGCNFSPASLNKYRKHGSVRNSLKQESILWLCARWGIPVKLHVGAIIKATDGSDGIEWVYPKYNEEKAIEEANKFLIKK